MVPIIMAAGIWLLSLHSASATEIMVSAAASLSDVLKEISVNFQAQTGINVVFNFGGSNTLARQIEAGAPADIFFSADETQMDGLAKKGLIDSSTRKSCLGNSLVVIVPNDSVLQIKSANGLTSASVKRIALADPKAVPAGVYAKAWLEKMHLWPSIAPKVAPMENVRATLAAVESGNMDAGVVYKTDAAISKKVKVVFEVPSAESPRISYPIALLKNAPSSNAAKRFLDYLAANAADAIFTRAGFMVLPAAGK